MFSQKGLVYSTACALSLALAAAPAVAAPCDPAYVSADSRTVVVQPTGTDDTANLRCAIETVGLSGGTVVLDDGIYRTAQLVVSNFAGRITGSGRSRTTLQNLETALPVAPLFVFAPPSDANPYPSLVTFLGSDVTFSNMTVAIVGDAPLQPWSIPGAPFPPVASFGNALQVMGSNADVRIERVNVTAAGCYTEPGGNINNGLSVWTFFNPFYAVSNTSVSVRDAAFDSCGGIAVENVVGSRVSVSGSTFTLAPPAGGLFVSDVTNSRVDAVGNTFVGGANGIVVWGGNFATGVTDATLLFRSNTFSGATGIALVGDVGAPTFHGEVPCAISGNNVQRTTGVGYLLLPGTYGCTLTGHMRGTVTDWSGGAHTISGVGQGPAIGRSAASVISSWLR